MIDLPPSTCADILTRDDGSTIAFHRFRGASPGVIFLTGFMSDMEGGKALEVEALCRRRGQAFLRFDYRGHGQSSGRFEDGTIGQWTEDALFALDHLSEGPQVLVGSSMGGWIMLLAALARPQRVAGLVGIAAAPDFTEDLIEQQLTVEQRQTLTRDGVVYVPSDYGPDPTPYTQNLIDEGRRHLLLRRPIALACPIRLLQGLEDPDVPWQTALAIQQMVTAPDVVVSLIKDGDHRLSRPQDLDRLLATINQLLNQLGAQP